MHSAVNFASTTLTGTHTNAVTTLNLATGGGALLGSDYPYFATIHTGVTDYTTVEVVEITATAGTDQLTAVRGADGVAAQAWTAGVTIERNPTAGYVTELQNMVMANTFQVFD